MSDPRRVLSEQSSGHTNANHWSLYYSYKRWCSLRHIIGDSNWAPVWQSHSRLMLSEGSHWSLWASLSSVSSDVWWQCVMWRSRGLSPDSDSEETRACAQHIGHSTVFRISHTHNYTGCLQQLGSRKGAVISLFWHFRGPEGLLCHP